MTSPITTTLIAVTIGHALPELDSRHAAVAGRCERRSSSTATAPCAGPLPTDYPTQSSYVAVADEWRCHCIHWGDGRPRTAAEAAAAERHVNFFRPRTSTTLRRRCLRAAHRADTIVATARRARSARGSLSRCVLTRCCGVARSRASLTGDAATWAGGRPRRLRAPYAAGAAERWPRHGRRICPGRAAVVAPRRGKVVECGHVS